MNEAYWQLLDKEIEVIKTLRGEHSGEALLCGKNCRAELDCGADSPAFKISHISRAIYRNPDFLFLDEATSSLDAENEKLITEGLNDVYNNRTVIVVAHRLSTVKNADLTVVLHNGEIAEIGTHAELVKNQGRYFNLIKNQLELGV